MTAVILCVIFPQEFLNLCGYSKNPPKSPFTKGGLFGQKWFPPFEKGGLGGFRCY